jgi:hypothetical protein
LSTAFKEKKWFSMINKVQTCNAAIGMAICIRNKGSAGVDKVSVQ